DSGDVSNLTWLYLPARPGRWAGAYGDRQDEARSLLAELAEDPAFQRGLRATYLTSRKADNFPMSSFQMSGCLLVNASMRSMQTLDCRLVSFTPRLRRVCSAPTKDVFSPMTTCGIPYRSMAPAHMSHGDKVVYMVARAYVAAGRRPACSRQSVSPCLMTLPHWTLRLRPAAISSPSTTRAAPIGIPPSDRPRLASSIATASHRSWSSVTANISSTSYRLVAITRAAFHGWADPEHGDDESIPQRVTAHHARIRGRPDAGRRPLRLRGQVNPGCHHRSKPMRQTGTTGSPAPNEPLPVASSRMAQRGRAGEGDAVALGLTRGRRQR